jgi:hypothetical protein
MSRCVPHMVNSYWHVDMDGRLRILRIKRSIPNHHGKLFVALLINRGIA